jgi:hypothetical protein
MWHAQLKTSCKVVKENLKESHRHRWEDNIKTGLSKIEFDVWTGFLWLKRGIND